MIQMWTLHSLRICLDLFHPPSRLLQRHEVLLLNVVVVRHWKHRIRHQLWCHSSDWGQKVTDTRLTLVLCFLFLYFKWGIKWSTLIQTFCYSDLISGVCIVCFGSSSKSSSLFELCFVTVVCSEGLKQKCSHIFLYIVIHSFCTKYL